MDEDQQHMAGPVNNPDVKTPGQASPVHETAAPVRETATPVHEPAAASTRSLLSPCERLWARYHSDPEGDKVEILAELIDHGCLERSTRSIDGPEIPVS